VSKPKLTPICVLAATLLWLAPARAAEPQPAVRASTPADAVEQGRRIYMEGVLPSGAPLTATRLGNAPLAGRPAACVACHKRSGMGATEGDVIVPPVTGQALYAGTKLRERVIVSMDPRRGRSWNPSHPPYGEDTLLAALRDGMHVTGRPMSPLMPRYAMQASDVAVLNAFLMQLSAQWSPGVSADSLRLATVITPEVPAWRREAFLKTLRAAVDQKNSNTLPGHRHMINAAEMVMRIERSWQLDVWELQGPPNSWAGQLQARYRQQPVFALVSGLGEASWEPVQAFCEREQVPCWFPSVALTPAHAQDEFYGLYFSDGVELEAQALASHLKSLPAAPARLVQVLREETAAQAGAHALRQALAHWRVEQRLLAGGAEESELRAAVAGLDAGDVLVLWLKPQDLEALGALPVPEVSAVYASTLLGGGEHAPVGAAWRPRLRLVYPYELPGKRARDLATFHSWLKVRGLEQVDEPMQSEVFFAVNYLQYTLTEMLDNVYGDYLVDRGETMLRRREAQRAEEETMIRGAGHPPPPSAARAARLAPGAIYGTDPQGPLAQANTPLVGERQGTTIYPRLSLAPGQRYASKGAYIVRFAGDSGEALQAESDWIVP